MDTEDKHYPWWAFVEACVPLFQKPPTNILGNWIDWAVLWRTNGLQVWGKYTCWSLKVQGNKQEISEVKFIASSRCSGVKCPSVCYCDVKEGCDRERCVVHCNTYDCSAIARFITGVWKSRELRGWMAGGICPSCRLEESVIPVLLKCSEKLELELEWKIFVKEMVKFKWRAGTGIPRFT